jgi:uncharacterized 2Fe-2S/4Fe-4S cluster protein (DUF4445 family)
VEYRITVEQGGEKRTLSASEGMLLSQALFQAGLSVPMICGGMGRCGKCHVLVDGKMALACRTKITKSCTVTLPEEKQKMAVAQSARGVEFPITPASGLGAAVDIGTTTVVLYLVDRATGKQLAVVSGENSQRSFGGDVISRIQACSQGEGLTAQRDLIRNQVNEFLRRACQKAGRMPEEVTALSVAGNTVMEHLFGGLDPTPIGVAPFRPQSLFGTTGLAVDYGISAGAGATLFLAPCVAGYVGGDITAGLLSCGIHRQEKLCLFLDLGTNGEMALGNREGFLTCAVAAGPAFEGGEITCGSTALPGAINRVWLEGDVLRYDTLNDRRAKSICGSGLLDLLAALVEAEAVEESGYFNTPEEYEGTARLPGLESGEQGAVLWLDERRQVCFTAKDVRKLQLAKAAVAAGIHTMLQEAGVTLDQVEKVYLAGGFGSFLNQHSACKIGLLPPELESRIESMGNSAGRGARDYLLSQEARRELGDIAASCRYLELSGHGGFGEYYVNSMALG